MNFTMSSDNALLAARIVDMRDLFDNEEGLRNVPFSNSLSRSVFSYARMQSKHVVTDTDPSALAKVIESLTASGYDISNLTDNHKSLMLSDIRAAHRRSLFAPMYSHYMESACSQINTLLAESNLKYRFISRIDLFTQELIFTDDIDESFALLVGVTHEIHKASRQKLDWTSTDTLGFLMQRIRHRVKVPPYPTDAGFNEDEMLDQFLAKSELMKTIKAR